MNRFYADELNKLTGKEIIINGWVHSRRDHGGMTFLDIRDCTGLTQVIYDPKNLKKNNSIKNIRTEYVVSVKGRVKPRPKNYVNKKIISGEVEIEATEIEILSSAETTPFEINNDTHKIDEETRLKYRYLDLRSRRMSKNIKKRHHVISFIQKHLNKQRFTEIETPILTKGTPEGAREFIVPSRLHKGKVFVLPQSPQQFKQLLMVAGFEKYYQIAKCLRDEDMRGDRQTEHTQLDIEMSFVKRENIMQLIEDMIISLVKVHYPDKKITNTPFPKLSYQETLKKYNTDKPDLRKNTEDKDELAFTWIIDFPLFEKDKKGNLSYSHNPFTAPKSNFENNLNENKNIESIISEQYDIACNGFEIGGGGIRIHDPKLLEKVFKILGHDKKTIKERFGHMLNAFKYGVPPHGGIALGLDRLLMILQDEPNIREVIAFPKTGDARDPMMDAPSKPNKLTLKELGVKFLVK